MSKVLTNKPGFYGVGSVEVSPPVGKGESGVRRLAISKDSLVTQPTDGIETAYDIVAHAARTHGNRNALGWREVVKIVEEEKEVTKVVDGKEIVEKKKWKYFELSDYKYMSYLDVKTAVSEIGRGLVDLGVSKGDVFNIYAQTGYALSSSHAL
jgi:long-chain acyl-CoA synthetase